MEQRINFQEKGQQAMVAMFGLGKYIAKSSIEKNLLNLMYFRVSQINGCAYCLDMHSKDLRASGETEQRLYLISSWRESPFYTDRERAALAWAESVTKLRNGEVPDEVYAEVSEYFTEAEIVDLTMAVVAINGWNRINCALGAAVGTYEIGQFH